MSELCNAFINCFLARVSLTSLGAVGYARAVSLCISRRNAESASEAVCLLLSQLYPVQLSDLVKRTVALMLAKVYHSLWSVQTGLRIHPGLDPLV